MEFTLETKNGNGGERNPWMCQLRTSKISTPALDTFQHRQERSQSYFEDDYRSFESVFGLNAVD